jgi:virulence factor Mce-like protein
MSRRPRDGGAPLSSTVIGSIILLVGIVGTVLAYNANRGLPFVPTYDITVEVPDAARLVAASSEVRVGGTRVGVVRDVRAVRPRGDRPPFARIRLALDATQPPLPLDSQVTIRPRSLLGAKYVALMPGTARATLKAGGTLPLARAMPVVEVSDTFDVFGRRSARALQDVLIRLGDATAGRGSQLNQTFGELHRGLPPLQAVLRRLTAPGTDLPGFVRGVAAFSGALAPRAAELASLLDGGATTFAALERSGPALPASVVELAATERVALRANARLAPVLADAAAIARSLRPAARALPRATRIIAPALRAATPGLRRARELRAPVEGVLRGVDRLVAEPAVGPAVAELTTAMTTVRSVLGAVLPAQLNCNLLGIWTRNTGSILSQGDANGNWLTLLLMNGPPDLAFQAATPSPTLHANPYPRTDAEECEAGNEPYEPGRRLGRPPGVQDATEETRPPAAARARAARAGLLGSGR